MHTPTFVIVAVLGEEAGTLLSGVFHLECCPAVRCFTHTSIFTAVLHLPNKSSQDALKSIPLTRKFLERFIRRLQQLVAKL